MPVKDARSRALNITRDPRFIGRQSHTPVQLNAVTCIAAVRVGVQLECRRVPLMANTV